MNLKKSAFHAVLVTGLVAGLGAAAIAFKSKQGNDDFPSQAEIDFADEANLILTNGMLAGLVDIFVNTTPANNERGQDAIRTIFDNRNLNLRLVSNGINNPQLGGPNNLPRDAFEAAALESALSGQGGLATLVSEEEEEAFSFRRSLPLNNNLHPNCVLCHTTFPPNQADEFVGVLIVRAPISDDEDDDE